jgi:Ca2+-binding EF-hand superfamily protein
MLPFSLADIGMAFRVLSMPVTEREIASLCKDAAVPDSGRVSFNLFATMAARQSMSVRSLEGMVKCFAAFDPENKGWISVADFRRIFEATGEYPVAGAALEDLQQMIDNYADPEDSGQVAYAAFVERLLVAKARVEAEEAKEKAGKK